MSFEPDRWYPTREIAQRRGQRVLHGRAPWGLSTHYQLIRSGLLPVKKLGRHYVARGADILRVIENLPNAKSGDPAQK